MTSFRETTQQYAHRQNLARYRRLLDTHLTAEERRFVERRVAEEHAALRRLSGSAAPEDISSGVS
jgi:hypothetical protein